MKLLLISSSGGHFNALCQLTSFWQNHDRQWVTFPTATTRNCLAQEEVHWAFGPTNRNLPNLCRNLGLAVRIIYQERPDIVITTGAGVAVPFLLFAKLLGIKTIFIESFTRVNDLSLSAKLILPCIDVLYVQWKQLQQRYPQAKLIQVPAQ